MAGIVKWNKGKDYLKKNIKHIDQFSDVWLTQHQHTNSTNHVLFLKFIMFNKCWIREDFFLLFADFIFPHVSGSSSMIFFIYFWKLWTFFSCLLKFFCIFPAMPSCTQEIEEVGTVPSVHTPCPPVCLPASHPFICFVAPLCSFSLNKPSLGVVSHLLSNSGVTWMSLPA